jgi:hypothetical protein
VADIFRKHIGTRAAYVLSIALRPHALTGTGPMRNVEVFDNGSTMEITFFNPDDAM